MSKHYIINFKSEISPKCHQFSVTYSSKFKSLTIDMSDTLGIKCSGKITSPLMDLRKQKTVIISQNAMVVLPLKWQYMFADTSTLSPFPACRISKVSHLCLFFFPCICPFQSKLAMFLLVYHSTKPFGSLCMSQGFVLLHKRLIHRSFLCNLISIPGFCKED